MKVANFTFCGGLGHKITGFFVFSLPERYSLLEFTERLKNSPTFDELNEMELSAIKFEATGIQFSNDVFVAVPVFAGQAP